MDLHNNFTPNAGFVVIVVTLLLSPFKSLANSPVGLRSDDVATSFSFSLVCETGDDFDGSIPRRLLRSYLSLNRKDELITPSPEDTLRSLGLISGDLIYQSLEANEFSSEIERLSNQAPQSESYHAIVHESMGIGVAEVDSNPNSGVEDSAEGYFALLQMILPSLLLVQLVNPFRRGYISLGLKSPRHYH
ncbi:unnamed protein product [Arabidopsis lyrata]|nr:unnamed protein product [Arabidopsis lyrata]